MKQFKKSWSILSLAAIFAFSFMLSAMPVKSFADTFTSYCYPPAGSTYTCSKSFYFGNAQAEVSHNLKNKVSTNSSATSMTHQTFTSDPTVHKGYPVYLNFWVRDNNGKRVENDDYWLKYLNNYSYISWGINSTFDDFNHAHMVINTANSYSCSYTCTRLEQVVQIDGK
jgi:hypothetical protein